MRNPFRRRRSAPQTPIARPRRDLTAAQRERFANVLEALITVGLIDPAAIDQDCLAEAVVGELPDDPSEPLGFDEVLGALIVCADDARMPTHNLATTHLWNELPDENVVAMARRICRLHGVDPSLELERDEGDPTVGSLLVGLEPPTSIGVTIPAKGVPDMLAERLAPLLADAIAPAELMTHVGGLIVHAILTEQDAAMLNETCGARFDPLIKP